MGQMGLYGGDEEFVNMGSIESTWQEVRSHDGVPEYNLVKIIN